MDLVPPGLVSLNRSVTKETYPLWLRTGKRDKPAVASHWQKRPTRSGFALAKETYPLWLRTGKRDPLWLRTGKRDQPAVAANFV